MSRRVLRSLLFRLTIAATRSQNKRGRILTVGVNDPPPAGAKLRGRKRCDLTVSDRIEFDGKVWEVTDVELAECDPPHNPN